MLLGAKTPPKIQFGTWECMFLPPEKHIVKYQKKNRLRLLVSTFYVCMPSFMKNQYFLYLK
jgi:hypothetical protein